MRLHAASPEPIAIAVTGVLARRAALAVSGAPAFDIRYHQALGDELEHLAQDVDIAALFNKLGKCDAKIGHRGSLQSVVSAKTTFGESHGGCSRLGYEDGTRSNFLGARHQGQILPVIDRAAAPFRRLNASALPLLTTLFLSTIRSSHPSPR